MSADRAKEAVRRGLSNFARRRSNLGVREPAQPGLDPALVRLAASPRQSAIGAAQGARDTPLAAAARLRSPRACRMRAVRLVRRAARRARLRSRLAMMRLVVCGVSRSILGDVRVAEAGRRDDDPQHRVLGRRDLEAGERALHRQALRRRGAPQQVVDFRFARPYSAIAIPRSAGPRPLFCR